MKRTAVPARSWILFTTLFGFGAVVMAGSLTYDTGSLRSMGPGYFPLLLGASLCVISFLIMIEDFLVARQSPPALTDTAPPPLGRHEIRILSGILGSILLFALFINSLGLVPATLACSAAAFAINPRSRLLESAVISLLLCAFTAVVFVYGLGIPVRLVAF